MSLVIGSGSFRGVLFDMDGVVTDTAHCNSQPGLDFSTDCPVSGSATSTSAAVTTSGTSTGGNAAPGQKHI